MTQLIDETPKLIVLEEAAIKNCQTHAYKAKDIAKDLRNNGFDGQLAAELVKELELSLKNAHLYQAYINSQDEYK